MMALPANTRIWIAAGVTDLRRGFTGLSALVETKLEQKPFSGQVFVSEVLEYVPDHFKVIRHVRTKLSCTKCDCIVQAAAPSRPIERGVAGPGLLAHVLVSKYADHLPLYRQSEIYARHGVELERSTLADWVGGTPQLLEPLVEALRRYAIAAGKLHADDTPVPVLAPGNGKTTTGRLWTYVRDDRPAGDRSAPACGLLTRRIAKVSIPRGTCGSSAACCKLMPTLDSTTLTKTGAFRKWHAGHMCGAISTTCNRRTLGWSQRKRSYESAHCTRLRKANIRPQPPGRGLALA